jgi:hypothetical protein
MTAAHQSLFGLSSRNLSIQLRCQQTSQQAADLWTLWDAEAFEISSGQVWSDVTPRREIVLDVLMHLATRAKGE